MDIPLTREETAKETLDEYQSRFLPESDSQLFPSAGKQQYTPMGR